MIAKSPNVFMTAAEARVGARKNLTIHTEIREIENQILTAVSKGQLSVMVNNTLMTTNQDYYKVWLKQTTDRVLDDQMNEVITYFTNLGYTVTRKQRSNTAYMNWEIVW